MPRGDVEPVRGRPESGEVQAAHRRLRAWEEAGIGDRLHSDLLATLERAGKLDAGTVIVNGATVRFPGCVSHLRLKQRRATMMA